MESEESKSLSDKEKRNLIFGTFTKKIKEQAKKYKEKKDFLDLQPVLFGQSLKNEKKVIIKTLDKKAVLETNSAIEAELILNLLSLCDGTNTVREISLEFVKKGYDLKSIASVIRNLFEKNVLVDSREIYLYFHLCLENPTYFYYDLTDEDVLSFFNENNEIKYEYEEILLNLRNRQESNFLKSLEKRESLREFKNNATLSFSSFSNLLWSLYGIIGERKVSEDKKVLLRTVPSGGALYPLHIYVLAWGNIENISSGVYYLKKTKDVIQKIRGDLRSQEVIKKLIPIPEGKEMIENALFMIVIVCDLKRIAQKYANRGYLYSILEAGHVAQNCYLYCAEQGLGVVEIGGFIDRDLIKFLDLEYPKFLPLTTLLIGRSI